MEVVKNGFGATTRQINQLFINREPWQVSAITTAVVLSSVWFWNIISEDECVFSRIRKFGFRLVRKIPAVRKRVEEEIDKLSKSFEEDRKNEMADIGYFTVMPETGLDKISILGLVEDYLAKGSYEWRDGVVSGAVYELNQDVVDLVSSVYSKASYTNPLHPDVFPGVCKMEAEVIRIAINLFNGNYNCCGTMTTGGTESIVMACKAYRDYAREHRGIKKPNMVVPRTAHAAFDKAGQYFNIYVRYVDVDPITTKVNIRAMRRAINRNTIMLVGSTPNYPYGTMDDIEEISKLGEKYDIPVHVDACLGGFLIAFMKYAGYHLPPFDFSLKGVTSISADTHKYGYAPKGSSVILYSDGKYLRHQFTVTTDWPGSVYGSPTVNGSRAGGIIAACWATLLYYGMNGYVENTKAVIDTSKYIEREVRKINGIYVFGTPVTSVVAMGSNDFDIFRLSDALCKKGWNLNNLQFPSGIHICVTMLHTKKGVAETLVTDIRDSVKELLLTPKVKVEGKMAIYGVAQTLPDRTLVGEITRRFLQSMYYTPKESEQ